MTQKTIKALYKQPVNYKLIRDGYKTINGVIQAQDGMPKVVDLSVPSELYTTDLEYNVDVDVNGAPVITTSEFTLPDDQTCEAKKYCYAPKGTNYNYSSKGIVRHYDNFTKIGSPTISQNGILSDITTSNYLRLPNNFNSGNNSWEMLFKIKTSSDITTEQSWIGSSNKTNCTYPLWRLKDGYVCLYLSSNGSSWDISSVAQTFQVSANTWYWVKLKFTGSSYESYYSTNGIDYILAYSVSSTYIIYQNQLWNIGCNNWSEGEYLQWLGIIDLSESYIKIDDEIWWVPYTYHEEEVTIQIPGILDSSVTTDNWQQSQEYKLYQLKNQNNTDSLQLTENSITDTTQKYKQYINQLTIPARDYKWYYHSIETGVYDNYNVIGSPTVNTTTGIVTGFSTSNYLQLPEAFNPGNNPWEMIFRVKTSSDFSDLKNNITGSNTQSNYQAISCGVSKDRLFKLGISVNGSSWDPGYAYGTYYVLPETWYYIKIQFTGSHYQLYYSLDGNNYILDIDTISSLPIYQNNTPYLIGLNKWSTDSDSWYPWTGTIDLSESYIKINGNLWWSPMSTKDKYKWMANKSIYDYSATGLYADTLDFTKSYVGVNDSEYHKYVNPKVCLMPIDGGETITAYSLNATEIGNINFNTDTGVASGFSSVDYLQLPYVIPSSFSTMEIVVKFKAFKIEGDDYPIINQLHAVKDIFIEGRSKKVCQWNGSERIEGQTIISEDMYYTLKITSNGVTNNIFVNDNLEFSTTSDIFKNVELCFGGTAAGQQYFPGFIDLNSCYIKINDEICWRGANSTVKEHQYITAKDTNYEKAYDISGIIKVEDKIASDFATGSYIYSDVVFPVHNTWEYITKFKITDSSIYNCLLSSDTSDLFGFDLGIRNNKIEWYIRYESASSGNSIENAGKGAATISNNTWYWVKFGFDGSKYYSAYSTNGITYTNDYEYASSTKCHIGSHINIGAEFRASNAQFKGSVDLANTSMSVNGQVIWKPIPENENRMLPGCLAIGATDDGTEQDWDVYYPTGYTQPILVPAGQTYSEGTKVDTITLPKHKTWEYSSGGIWNSYAEIDVSNSNYTNTDGNLVLTEYTGNAQDITLPNPEL